MSQINESQEQTPANGLYVGEIRLLPFRPSKLPSGWYFCNGERYEFTTPQGQVLTSLDADFRADWGLEEDQCSINLPNLFSQDGRGCFLRPVDGVTRQPGAAQGDAIRNITGTFAHISGGGEANISPKATTGAFKTGNIPSGVGASYDNRDVGSAEGYLFDTSLTVPTADENRPLNLGMTPAIYLGV